MEPDNVGPTGVSEQDSYEMSNIQIKNRPHERET